MPPEKRTLVLTHFPRFLSLLEEEIYSTKSPIWDVDFRQAPPPHVGTYLPFSTVHLVRYIYTFNRYLLENIPGDFYSLRNHTPDLCVTAVKLLISNN